MFSLSYAIKHIYRSCVKCISMISIVLIYVLLFCGFSNSIIEQEIKLDLLYKTMPIYVEVSDVNGDEIYNLAITEGYYINTFVSEKYGLSNYIKDLTLRRVLDVYMINGRDLPETDKLINLIGITNVKEENNLNDENDVVIEFLEGCGYDIFTKLHIDDSSNKSDDNCLVGEEFLMEYNMKVGDTILLTVRSGPSVYAKKSEYGTPILNDVKTKLTIVGVIKGKGINDIYCSWDKAADLGGQSDESGVKFSNIMRATIVDNYKIKSFKEKAKEYYTPVNASSNADSRGYSLTVYDDIFMKSVLQIQRNLQFLKAIYPLILSFSFAIGYLLSYLFTRNRRREVAVMRSLGISRNKTFITIILELSIINIIGILFSTTTCKYLLKANVSINAIMLFFLFNTLGATLSTLKISSGSVMAIMKDKE